MEFVNMLEVFSFLQSILEFFDDSRFLRSYFF